MSTSYHAAKRVVIGPPGTTEATKHSGIVIHEDRGDGAAACAVGKQMGTSKPFLPGDEWVPLGPGQVTCELCGRATGDPVRKRAGRPRVAPPDAGIALSLDERIARRKQRDSESRP